MPDLIDTVIDQINANPTKNVWKDLKGATPWSVRILILVSNALQVVALLAFVMEPNPRGLVNAAWFYIIAKILAFFQMFALGLNVGRKRMEFLNSLPESKQRQLTRMFIIEESLQGFYGLTEDSALFLDHHAEVIRAVLEKD
jgi:hypothetical protein